MTIFEAILLGIVEGVTEFLPISSTGHLILASGALGIPHTAFTGAFEVAIQFGAILAVVALYWRSFLDVPTLKKLLAAFLPTALVGLAAYPLLKSFLLGSQEVVLAALFLGGVFLIVFEYLRGPREDIGEAPPPSSLTYREAVLVGLAQALAIIPGVSRSGATIIGGLALGLKRTTIVEFSFLLAVPTMLAATTISLGDAGHSFTGSEWAALATGFLVSFLVAMPVVRWLLAFVRNHSFIGFGVYRIVLSAVFAFVLFF